jgi:hypothetical protein
MAQQDEVRKLRKMQKKIIMKIAKKSVENLKNVKLRA